MPGACASEQPRICYVSMPFGQKQNSTTGEVINFDNVYELGIKPAVESVGLQSVRADEELQGGIIHKSMLSRLLTSPYCVFDLTTANPNVLYELGIRHTARAAATITIFAHTSRIPFDVVLMRAIPYELTGGQLTTSSAEQLKAALTSRLQLAADSTIPDCPLFQLFNGFPGVNTAVLGRAPEVFLSYAHADADRVQPLYEKLKAAGFKRLGWTSSISCPARTGVTRSIWQSAGAAMEN